MQSPQDDRSTGGAPLPDIRPVYQPVVALDTRTVVGFEALVRPSANSPCTSPEQLFTVAEDRNCMVEFDWHCRLTAVQGALAARFPRHLQLFVNAEPAALGAPPPPESRRLLAEARSLSVIVEITERQLMSDVAGLLGAVAQARDNGWRVAVDDVGADASSLALLALVRPDVIKLDMRLTHGRSTRETAAILTAVGAEADRTGAVVLAEGIESEAHERWAHDIGAVWGQGWLYGPPGALPVFDAHARVVDRWTTQPAVTVRAPVAVTPGGLARQHSRLRHGGEELVEYCEYELLRRAESAGSTGIVLVTASTSTEMSDAYRSRLDDLASRTALTAVFDSRPAPAGHCYRAVGIGSDEPLALERSMIVVDPLFHGALIAVHDGRAHDGSPRYKYLFTLDREFVLDAATVLMHRIPGPDSVD